MKQYCRYCVNAYLQGDDMIWCEPKDEIRTDRQITRLNRCPHFEFCSIDVLNPEREYRPVEKRRAVQKKEPDMEQMYGLNIADELCERIEREAANADISQK